MGDEGMFKSEVTKELLEARCPYVKVEAYTKDFEAFTKENIVVDLIIDATDNLPIRAEIDKYAKLTKTPWIYGSVEAWNGQVCFFDKSSFDIFKITNRKPAGITAPIVMHIASMQANLALRYLTNASVKKDYLYYLFFDDDGIFQMQKFSLPQ
jgi:molybdopterin/thiamine biosynthesis adenylyltransferase